MIIVNASKSGKIYKMYLQLYPLVSISQQLDPLYKRSMSEHVLLIKEMLKGNTKKAKNILEKHLVNCRNDSIKFLRKYEIK